MRDKESPGRLRAEARRTASEKHDAQFFIDRKDKETRNLELNQKLKAQRLAHEAARPKVEGPVRATRKRKDPDAD